MLVDSTTNQTSALNENQSFVWGKALAVQALNGMVTQLARTTIPVLLVGESGTGKEMYGRAIHQASGGGPDGWWKVSCTAIEPVQFQQAMKEFRETLTSQIVSTLFLDEVEELSPECQKLLLSMVPHGELEALEGRTRARIVSAAMHDLHEEVAEGRFRRELYFRLNGACLRLPALRERMEDLGELVECFLARYAEQLKRSAPSLNTEAMDLLISYHWPGNIRELENVARKMVALGDTALAVSDLRVSRINPVSGTGKGSSLKMAARAASRQTERELILQALQRTKWNRKRAARDLQISYKSLLYKLKQMDTPGTAK